MTYARQYYLKNREKIIARNKEYLKIPEHKKRNQVAVCKHRALKKGIEFSITEHDLDWVETCPILNIPLSWEGSRENSPSIDRIDPTKGYTKENCRVISYLANSMKSNATKEQLESFAKNILLYVENAI